MARRGETYRASRRNQARTRGHLDKHIWMHNLWAERYRMPGGSAKKPASLAATRVPVFHPTGAPKWFNAHAALGRRLWHGGVLCPSTLMMQYGEWRKCVG